MDNALSRGAEDRLAYERSKASNARMLCEGVPELILQWARQEGKAQKQRRRQVLFFHWCPNAWNPHPSSMMHNYNVSAMCAGGPEVCPLGSCLPFPSSNPVPPSTCAVPHVLHARVSRQCHRSSTIGQALLQAVIMSRSELCTPHTGAEDRDKNENERATSPQFLACNCCGEGGGFIVLPLHWASSFSFLIGSPSPPFGPSAEASPGPVDGCLRDAIDPAYCKWAGSWTIPGKDAPGQA